MAAEAEGAIGSAARPHGAQIDSDGRKNWDVQDGKDALGKFFGLFEFQSNATETEINDPGAPGALISDDGVGVRARHGDSLRFALNRVTGWGSRRGGLFRQSTSGR
jgi:hypothetical protein